MALRKLGGTGLEIAPLVLGTNVFGWTTDQATSFKILDGFVDAGLNAIDTADMYSVWVPGHQGGESETIIGNWLQVNPGKRDKVLIFTKVGMELAPDRTGLSPRWITQAVEDSLRRLRTDRIDLYQSHRFDPDTPHEETLATYAKLIADGKIRAIGASNFDAKQLGDALQVARDKNLPRYETLQPLYNLYDRDSFDGALRDLTLAEGIGVIPYYGLAAGFLTGKYRSEADLANSNRARSVTKYLNPRGLGIVEALREVAARNNAQPGEAALAWLIERKGVTAPIASATSLGQLEGLVKATRLLLPAEDLALLDKASLEAA